MVNIQSKRIENLIEELSQLRYTHRTPLKAEVTTAQDPIPLDQLNERTFTPITPGTLWGELWDSSWFRFSGTIPASWEGREIVALIDIGGGGCVFKDGVPYCGLTYKKIGNRVERKRRVMLTGDDAHGDVTILVEGAANGLFGGSQPGDTYKPVFKLVQAELAIFDRDIWDLSMDMEYLLQLYEALDKSLPRAKRILRALSQAANLTPLTSHIAQAKEITSAVLQTPSPASELTAWSVGHAHLDLGWLWRFRETRRKAARTFSTALRMIEEYPDYVFGASQPQLFQWVKEDYPELYAQIKEAISKGRIECQGGMWVEPDMNLTGGESLVRQCLYGKRFFKEEFGKEINNLWLPDVFGYSAALPQILKKSGIDHFITQKISWNETNTFPHHTFLWYGIDGTPIETHFLPTDDYNCDNHPQKLIEASHRFAQSDIHDGYLNLFGIGDGGGGPSRRHIEWAIRGEDCEGVPKMHLSPAGEFMHYLEEQDVRDLPVWRGELYLELHRGTYTTQALIKKYNRTIELKLRDVEFLGSVALLTAASTFPALQLRQIWKDTMLHQFHDVLPGSSIREVYEDANGQSEKNLQQLSTLQDELLLELTPSNDPDLMTFVNTQPWERTEIVNVYGDDVSVTVPSMGYRCYSLATLQEQVRTTDAQVRISEDCTHLENDSISVTILQNGNIGSILLKECGMEMLQDPGAGIFKLYEDKPYSWDAWDVSLYYQDTTPEYAQLIGQKIIKNSTQVAMIEQQYRIGHSAITQVLELRAHEALLRATCKVQWNETNKMLRLFASTDISWPTATYEIQYGTIERPTHSNTSWDEAKFEVCGHRFADLSQTDRGMALINDCKYGYRIYQGYMELNLLRSPVYPDDQADRGSHEFSYAYMPHTGPFNSSDVFKIAHDFNSPLYQIQGRGPSESEQLSFFSTDTDQVCIEVVKPAEDGNGTILRCYETRGGSCSCTIETALPFTELYEVSLLEQERKRIAVPDPTAFSSSFTPFEIKTFLLL
jgi:alpha-mannosidase